MRTLVATAPYGGGSASAKAYPKCGGDVAPHSPSGIPRRTWGSSGGTTRHCRTASQGSTPTHITTTPPSLIPLRAAKDNDNTTPTEQKVSNRNSVVLSGVNPLTHSSSRQNLQRLTLERRAKRVHFFRNGDKLFKGLSYAVSLDRIRKMETLMEELTQLLMTSDCRAGVLPLGVRFIFSLENGKRVVDLDGFQHGHGYVCSSTDSLIDIDYYSISGTPPLRAGDRRSLCLPPAASIDYTPTNAAFHPLSKSASGAAVVACGTPTRRVHSTDLVPMTLAGGNGGSLGTLPSSSQQQRVSGLAERLSSERTRSFVRPRRITVLRNGTRPRKAVRVLLNRKTAHLLEQVFEDISKLIQLDSGAVRRVYGTTTGRPVTTLADFFADDFVFVAYGASERHSIDDCLLDEEEIRVVTRICRVTPIVREKRLVISGRHRRMSPVIDESCTSPSTLDKEDSARRSSAKSMDAPELPPHLTSRYEIGRRIGDGNFATVHECFDRHCGEKYAIKAIDKVSCAIKDYDLQTEVIILRTLKHPNIVQLFHEHDTETDLFLFLELVPGGDLFDLIADATRFPEDTAAAMMGDLLSALHYLHDQFIVHRDIKPENLLVVNERSIKLADFGLARRILPTERLRTVCGTPTYVAPEILAETGYGLKVDIWASGVILYILLCGFPPFVCDSPQDNQEELFDQILSGQFEFLAPYFDDVSDGAKQLIEKMLVVNEEHRLNAVEALRHPWLKRGCNSPDSAMSMSTESMQFERRPVHYSASASPLAISDSATFV